MYIKQARILLLLAVTFSLSSCKSLSSGSSASPSKQLFVTALATQIDGNFGGVTAADAKCEAEDPDNTGTYKAMIIEDGIRIACTSANCDDNGTDEHIDWVLAPNTRYVQRSTDVEVGVTNSKGVFDFPLTTQIYDITWNAYTGLNGDWTPGNNCQNWTSNNVGDTATYGTATQEGESSITSVGTTTCNNVLSIYCIEQ